MSEMVEKLRSIIERQKDERGDILYKNGVPDFWLVKAIDYIECLENRLGTAYQMAGDIAATGAGMEKLLDYLSEEPK